LRQQPGEPLEEADDFPYNTLKDPVHSRDFHPTLPRRLGFDRILSWTPLDR
jgi:hypothetical protein